MMKINWNQRFIKLNKNKYWDTSTQILITKVLNFMDHVIVKSLRIWELKTTQVHILEQAAQEIIHQWRRHRSQRLTEVTSIWWVVRCNYKINYNRWKVKIFRSILWSTVQFYPLPTKACKALNSKTKTYLTLIITETHKLTN